MSFLGSLKFVGKQLVRIATGPLGRMGLSLVIGPSGLKMVDDILGAVVGTEAHSLQNPGMASQAKLALGMAKWFANRWQTGKGRVATIEVRRSDIIAVLLGRSEQEVIYIEE